MGSWLDDLRFSLRSLKAHRVYAALAVLTLALGIGANSAIFSVVHALLLRPLPYRAAHELVWVTTHVTQFNADIVGGGDYLDWRERTRALSAIAAYDGAGGALTLTGRGEPARVRSARVTTSFLSLLDVPPHLGRAFTADDERQNAPPVVVLTAGTWARLFGRDVALAGQTLTLDGRAHTIVGVMPPGFVFPGRPEIDMIQPMRFDEATERSRRQMSIVSVLGRLAPGATADMARRELQAIRDSASQSGPAPPPGDAARIEMAPGEAPGGPPRFERVEPRADVRVVPLRTHLVGDARSALWLLMGTVGLILLMACANVANLVLARAVRRQHELSTHAALGATRARLIRRLLVESLMLGLAGGVAGAATAWPILDVLVARVPADVASGLFRQLSVGPDWTVLAFTLAMSISVAMLFGVGPAIVASGVNVSDALRDSSRQFAGGRRHSRARRLLIVGEVALTAVLLVGAGLLVRSFSRLLAVDPGFRPASVVAVGMDLSSGRYDGPEAFRAFYTQAIERLSAMPGVAAVAVGDTVPLSEFTRLHIGLRTDGAEPHPDQVREIALSGVSPDYFTVMGMRLTSGRAFTAADREGGARVAIVNQRMARLMWGAEQVVGRRVQVDPNVPEWTTIVGVVGDVHHDGLDVEPRAAMYVPFLQEPEPIAFLVVRTAVDAPSIVREIRRVIQGLDPALPVHDVTTMEQRLADSVAARRFTLLLLSVFAALAVVLAAVGLYGVLSSTVAERTREIGIRVALGARPAQLRRHVIGEGMLLVVVGAFVGLLTARVLGRGLEASLFEILPNDPLTFASIAGLLLAVGLAASAAPAIRATRIDPIEALRKE
jgi:putative ABC transport system permease protein